MRLYCIILSTRQTQVTSREQTVQPKNRLTGPITLKICTGPIWYGLGPLAVAVMLKNADNANNVDTGLYTAGGGDQRAPPMRTFACVLTAARPTPTLAPFHRRRHRSVVLTIV